MIQFTIIDEADQSFAAVLGGRRISMRLRYNTSTDRWNLDLSIDDQPVLTGRKIVTGIDILAPFNFGIGAVFALSEKTGNDPNRNNLPRGLVNLYHATAAEVAGV